MTDASQNNRAPEDEQQVQEQVEQQSSQQSTENQQGDANAEQQNDTGVNNDGQQKHGMTTSIKMERDQKV